MNLAEPSVVEHGAERHAGAAVAILAELQAILATVPIDNAGVRLRGLPGLKTLLDVDGPIGTLAGPNLGPAAKPVRALLFDKSAKNNWSLSWHQDRTIAVVERRDTEGFGPWTIKAGMPHVEPPAALQAAMITLRVHLDPVDENNAPLLVAPGSHRMGRIPQADIPLVVRHRGILTCPAEAGDVWIYSTPILHASEAAACPRRRRVLQIDYAATDLPGGLQWLGI
ncbi:Phytanoyl-CoA dioxygenase (PhyH) [Enhydrobacter aerosaccus]|uniref:Phytanoyl-CoA dioxygenase (PhyH) n=1 Tax=Enhydrobacter aerosaccus TaxID=225324 RepID=A0A1T4JN79_9HYPH|nr:phytanoyl-CoA dioxygenase family protein [Enhydrobacter aerosaccus]SJZ31614.1 Phytanoyl-CoA dioxygenase (PhyH) [Enhydrobacter aerosaccus]